MDLGDGLEPCWEVWILSYRWQEPLKGFKQEKDKFDTFTLE